MDEEHYNLKQLREAADIELVDLVAMINLQEDRKRDIDLEEAKTYEGNPDEAPAWVTGAWQKACGYGEEGAALDPQADYTSLIHRREVILGHLTQWPDTGFDDIDKNAGFDINGLLRACSWMLRKPRLATSGGFDSAKSHLSNCLMGEKILPSNYAPETSAINVAMHLEDRPDWFEGTVAIMADGFDLNLLYDPGHFQEHLLDQGGLDMLVTYATHQKRKPGGDESGAEHVTAFGEQDSFWSHQKSKVGLQPISEDAVSPTKREPAFALLFLDVPLLKSVTLLDPPGYNSCIAGDEGRAAWLAGKVDAVIYLSTSIGFWNSTDIPMLRHVLFGLPNFLKEDEPRFESLENLYVVASHCNQNFEDRRRIVEAGAGRIWKDLESVFNQRDPQITQETVRGRLFPFWSDWPQTRKDIYADLTGLLKNKLPPTFIGKMENETDMLFTLADTHYLYRLDEIDYLLADDNRRQEEYQIALTILEKFLEMMCKYRFKLQAVTDHAKNQSELAIDGVIRQYTDPAFIEALIKRRFEDGGEAEKNASHYIRGCLQDAVKSILASQSNKVEEVLKSIVRDYQVWDARVDTGMGIKIANDTNTVTGAAFGGLLGSVGMGIYSAGLGVGALTSLSMAIPVIAVTAVIGATLIWAYNALTWPERLAQVIVESFVKNHLAERLKKSHSNFWLEIEGRNEVCLRFIEENQQTKFNEKMSNANKTTEQARRDLQEKSNFLADIRKRLAHMREAFHISHTNVA